MSPPWLAPLALAAALVGCASSSIEVDSEADPSIDFSRYATWDWLPEARERQGNLGIDEPLRAAVEAGLAARGYERAPGRADFHLDYHARTESRISSAGAVPGRGGARRSRAHRTEEGELVLEAVDPGGRIVLWWGAARDVLQYGIRDEQIDARVYEAVGLILEQFPSR